MLITLHTQNISYKTQRKLSRPTDMDSTAASTLNIKWKLVEANTEREADTERERMNEKEERYKELEK
jgi:hypothetical protein